jgi:hypothetical protein
MAGLAAFFLCIVFLWIIAFRRYGARMGEGMMPVSTPETDVEEQQNVRIVAVPIAGVVDGGPLLGGRVMRIADRDAEQRRTVRKLIAPTAPPTPTSPASPVPSFPDETQPEDCSQQQTQALPSVSSVRKPGSGVFYNRLGHRLVVCKVADVEILPHDNWN